ncbi:hypothetical protein [Gorillibacterium massiliense]|uniref:hypothetical protein n=1 Tax=Gorillibacterium massiliense TaxID=1280390 RepID=UPI0004B70FF4|nr:hypothetical protein [Gorillibacterium massiliense]
MPSAVDGRDANSDCRNSAAPSIPVECSASNTVLDNIPEPGKSLSFLFRNMENVST